MRSAISNEVTGWPAALPVFTPLFWKGFNKGAADGPTGELFTDGDNYSYGGCTANDEKPRGAEQ